MILYNDINDIISIIPYYIISYLYTDMIPGWLSHLDSCARQPNLPPLQGGNLQVGGQIRHR